MASNRCDKCGKWFMSRDQLMYHEENADRLCLSSSRRLRSWRVDHSLTDEVGHEKRRTKMRKPIDHKEARTRIAALLPEEPALRFIDGGYVGVEINPAPVWSAEVTVYVNETLGWASANAARATYKVKINWSGTGRSLAQATSAIANYQAAVTLAAQIQGVIESFGEVVQKEEE